MANFPRRTNNGTGDLIKPTSRRFSIGDYPTKTYRSLSGAVVKRSFGNKASGYKLELSFDNAKEDVVAAIFDHYHGQAGITEGFSIPATLFSGYEDSTVSRMQAPDGISWFYEQAPQIESVTLALSTISISLIGELVA